MGQCSGAYFVYFSLFFVNITVNLVSFCQFPLTKLALGLGHATAAVSFYQLPVLQFSRVSCFFFSSSYIIGKWQCQKLVASTISENSFVLVSQVTQVWKEWKMVPHFPAHF